MKADPRLCLALDVPRAEDAERWVHRTRATFGTFKIGLRLFCAEGPAIVRRIREAGAARIFLDLKLHDIPQTVADAIGSLADLGVDDLTVHTAGGPEMLRAAVAAAAPSGTRLLGVSVLTSLDPPALAATGVERAIDALVLQRARLAVECGVPGLVCSPHELPTLRAALGGALELVTPGIRLVAGTEGDQKRAATPRRALAGGADRLVIGRAVTAAADVERALADLRDACGPAPEDAR